MVASLCPGAFRRKDTGKVQRVLTLFDYSDRAFKLSYTTFKLSPDGLFILKTEYHFRFLPKSRCTFNRDILIIPEWLWRKGAEPGDKEPLALCEWPSISTFYSETVRGQMELFDNPFEFVPQAKLDQERDTTAAGIDEPVDGEVPPDDLEFDPDDCGPASRLEKGGY